MPGPIAPLLLVLLGITAPQHPRLSPFDGLRWSGPTPEVQVGSDWYELLAIDDVKTGDILDFCRRRYGDRWQKRFVEDLVEVLSEMEHPPQGNRVKLEVRDLRTGKTRTLASVTMTREKREKLRRANAGDGPSSGAVERVDRKHAKRAARSLKHLQKRIAVDTPWGSRRLPASDAAQDLDQLEWEIEHRFSYRDLRRVDYRAAFDTVRLGLDDGISCGAFAVQLMKLLALFGDAHSIVTEHPADCLPPGYLPFLLAETADGVVAFHPDRRALLDEERPFLVAIDGVPLKRWREAMEPLISRGSPQLVKLETLRRLRFVALARQELGLPARKELTIELRGADGADGVAPREITLEVSERYPTYGIWPRPRPATRLDGEIGYLRIGDMDDEPDFLSELRQSMEEVKETRGLIIDVRGNRGGTRDALALLLPYFLPADDPWALVNVATPRRDGGPASREGFLADRSLFPLTASAWSDADRKQLKRCLRKFRPQWKPRRGFGEWHFFVIDGKRNAPPFHYENPVVVLMDSACFSATDIFLGAFAGRPGVTLLGTPSGGGSGRSRGFKLVHSRIDLKLSTMVSFRPDGRLYDGHGIEPDERMEITPGDLLQGGSDTILERARRRLTEKQ